ncbi:MAG: hypothetical protein EZS28_011400 [Streblomastix strix]|uniref:Reverse transcriptase domain-containing protein n=1 Tax=Streblomastix strix TaxID=222440 RepID=A0A5J4WDL0_9EUKA|nr:MAG: hypothetical protein EZS28_011400 [Streblomastix strix]
MFKDLEGPKFFSQAAYLSHSMNSIPTGIPNFNLQEAVLWSIDGDFDQAHLKTAMDDARKQLKQQLASTIDKDADESLRVTAEAVNTSITKHRRFTWNISYVEMALPEDIQQIQKTLINAQTNANIALAIRIAATHQQLDCRAESKRIETWLASTEQDENGIRAARQGLKEASNLVINNGWAITWDLQSAYSHIKISPELNRFLAFSFEGLIYTHNSMPFGTATAPRVFTKAMKIVIQNLSAHSIYCTSYLDDGIEQFQNQDEAKSQMIYTVNLFMGLELTINFQKSMQIPTQNPTQLAIQ